MADVQPPLRTPVCCCRRRLSAYSARPPCHPRSAATCADQVHGFEWLVPAHVHPCTQVLMFVCVGA
ncbi:hypothetical protein EON67_09215 [archaeon]|nr:MAG: hypothetical protein EON67_09215 [archaeon]